MPPKLVALPKPFLLLQWTCSSQTLCGELPAFSLVHLSGVPPLLRSATRVSANFLCTSAPAEPWGTRGHVIGPHLVNQLITQSNCPESNFQFKVTREQQSFWNMHCTIFGLSVCCAVFCVLPMPQFALERLDCNCVEVKSATSTHLFLTNFQLAKLAPKTNTTAIKSPSVNKHCIGALNWLKDMSLG